jgi:hypothetical protein
MAKTKDTPKLPSSSRMQMPSMGDGLGKKIAEYGGMGGGKASKSVTASARGKKGMKGSNPYGTNC